MTSDRPPEPPAQCRLVSATDIDLSERVIRVGDIVEDQCDADARMREAVIAILPRHGERITLTRRALAGLVRRRLPGLDPAANGEASIAFNALRVARPSASASNCYAAAHALSEGAALSGEDLRHAPCVSGENPALIYDRAMGVVRATRAIGEGEALGSFAAPPRRFADTGDELSLSVAVGPVRVERTVTALQPAPKGGAVFVRDAEGHIFSAPIGAPAP